MSDRGDLDNRRGKFLGRLFGGRQQPPAEPPAEEAPRLPPGEVSDEGVTEDLTPFDPGLERSLPPGMAELIVKQQSGADGAPRFRLSVACCCRHLHDLGVEYGQPLLDLGANLVEGGSSPSKFVHDMNTWSYEQTELSRWLDHRRGAHPDNLELVVWDNTGFRIPWELLWLPTLQETGRLAGYLGTLLPVTRWLPMKPWWPEHVRPYTSSAAYRASGPAVAYISSEMDGDREFMQPFLADADGATSMDHLFQILADQPAPLALVYVACHAEFGDDPRDCVLGGFPLGSVTEYNDDLPRLRSQPVLVFLNGCQTGSIGIDKDKYNDGALRGFAEVFLRCGAAGVLATTGAVGKEEAGTLARILIGRLNENADLNVADAIRQSRAAEAEAVLRLVKVLMSRGANMPKDERIAKERELLKHLYPFMYIHFGSPRLVMSLTRAGGQG